jgi:hypothetical protein
MKTKFVITNEVFSCFSIEEAKERFDEMYKDEGWIFDEDAEECYMILDKEIQLNEGDRVDVNAVRIVRWKCLDVLNDTIVYSLGEE